MDPNPQIAEALTGCVEAHMNAVETSLLEAAKKTVPGLNGNEAGMADAQNTIYHMIEAWAKRHQMVLDYSQMLKNAPYIGSHLTCSICGKVPPCDHLVEPVPGEYHVKYPLNVIQNAMHPELQKVMGEETETILDAVFSEFESTERKKDGG
jgi:hypothetical protein